MHNPEADEMPRDSVAYQDYVANTLRDHTGKLDTLEGQIAAVHLQNEDIIQILELARGFFKFCKYLGIVAKWVAAVAAAVLALWKLGEHFIKTPGGP